MVRGKSHRPEDNDERKEPPIQTPMTAAMNLSSALQSSSPPRAYSAGGSVVSAMTSSPRSPSSSSSKKKMKLRPARRTRCRLDVTAIYLAFALLFGVFLSVNVSVVLRRRDGTSRDGSSSSSPPPSSRRRPPSVHDDRRRRAGFVVEAGKGEGGGGRGALLPSDGDGDGEGPPRQPPRRSDDLPAELQQRQHLAAAADDDDSDSAAAEKRRLEQQAKPSARRRRKEKWRIIAVEGSGKASAAAEPSSTPSTLKRRPRGAADDDTHIKGGGGDEQNEGGGRREESKSLPYFLQGKYRFLRPGAAPPGETRRELLTRMARDPTEPVLAPLPPSSPSFTTSDWTNNTHPTQSNTWVLNAVLQHPTRNHDSVVLEDVDPTTGERRTVVYNILGRYSRYVQSMDLFTGERKARRTEDVVDPEGRPLDDLNHVSAVLVDAVLLPGEDGGGDGQWSTDPTQKEIWIPCGFHGDAVNNETSSDYVRIVDVSTMITRAGPRLPHSGGACVATSLEIIPSEPPMICAFAGTRGTHDAGIFLPDTACYDRVRERWWDPFGPLPYGLDHGSLAVVPPGRCMPNDPARILIFNFRTEPYGDSHPEFLAYDLPSEGWTIDRLEEYSAKEEKAKRIPEHSEWYLYHNVTDLSDPKNEPRDASGVVLANGGRTILNFGGTAHRMVVLDPPSSAKGVGKRQKRKHKRKRKKTHKPLRRKKVRFSMIRSFDVCDGQWSIVGDLGLSTFALQSCGSAGGNVAITCGGEAPLHDSNSPLCFASRWEGMSIDDQHRPVEYIIRTSKRGGDGGEEAEAPRPLLMAPGAEEEQRVKAVDAVA